MTKRRIRLWHELPRTPVVRGPRKRPSAPALVKPAPKPPSPLAAEATP